MDIQKRYSKWFDANFGSISLRLIYCYERTKQGIDMTLICFKCFGIVVHPKACRECKISICESCLILAKSRDLICLCPTFKKENFSFDTKFTIYRELLIFIADHLNKNQVKFNSKSSDIQILKMFCNYNFFDYLDRDVYFLDDMKSSYISGNTQILHKVIDKWENSKKKLPLSFIKATEYIRKFNLILNQTVMCSKDADKISKIARNIKAIKLINSKFSIDFSIGLSKTIIKLGKKLQYLEIIKCNFDSTSLVIILKALYACKYIKTIIFLLNHFTTFESSKILNPFEFLANKNQLEHLELNHLYLNLNGIINYPIKLSNLKLLLFSQITFQRDLFLNFFNQIIEFPHLSSLHLTEINIETLKTNKKGSAFNCVFKENCKVTHLSLNINENYTTEDSITSRLYYSAIKHLKLVELNFKFISSLAKEGLYNNNCEMLSKVKTLKHLSIFNANYAFKNDNIIKFLSCNESIIDLSLYDLYNQECNLGIKEILIQNKKIKSLKIENSYLEIDSHFIQGLIENKSLEKLYFNQGFRIVDEFIDNLPLFSIQFLIMHENILEKEKKTEIMKKASFCKLKIEFYRD